MPGNVLPNEEILTDLVTRFILNVPYSEWECVGVAGLARASNKAPPQDI